MARRKNLNDPPPSGNPSVSPEVGIVLLKKQIGAAEALLNGDALISGYYAEAWDNATLNYVEKAFGPKHRNVEVFLNATASAGNYGWSPEQWSAQRAEDLRGKVTVVNGFIEQLEMEIQLREHIAPSVSTIDTTSSNRVFIVHGHDGELKEAAARLVERLGLDAIILHEQPNRGRTIIEKFADHAQDAGFAVVLLSADDEGRSRDAPSDPLKFRARQNVIFEMGFFFRHLGRGRVCAVYETGVELPSDLQGILYIPYDQGGSWKHRVAQEMKDAGYNIDLNKLKL